MQTDVDRPTTAGRFWLLNSLAWGAYFAFNLQMGRNLGGGISSALLLISISLAGFLWLISAGIRALAHRRRWWHLSALQLGWRLLLAVLIGSTLAQLGVGMLLLPASHYGWVQMPGARVDYRPGMTLVYWLNTAIMLSLWTGVWAGLRSLRRARHSELARLRIEAEHSALERDALRARLNPHFVFNALNNLRALINEDPARAREMVTRLSNTLRHALEHSGDGMVLLQRELEVVDDYLAVEQVHYEQRLQVRQHIDPAARSAQLPPMALQLLVENGIKHGIAVTPGGGELEIDIRREADMLKVQVSNPLPPQPAAPGHGVGLAYLRAQLGNTGRIELQQQNGRMYAVLQVPQ